MGNITRRTAILGLGLAAVSLPLAAGLAGCSSDGDAARQGASASAGADGGAARSARSSADASGAAKASSARDAAGAAAAAGATVRLGTMPTEDFLPGWVAERDGLAKGVTLAITSFQSAQELSTAVAAGEIDMAMTDPMVSAALAAGGTDVRMPWITLGAEADQGRFGIMTSGTSGLTSPEDLRGATIGVGSNTVPEYVMDRLLEGLGIGEGEFTVEEVKKLPVRYQMMESDQVQAAALPGSLLALGEATGCVTLIDDTTGDNISQSVMLVRSAFADAPGGAALVDAVRAAWDAGAEAINADPEAYRSLLVEKANLSDAVADTYPIATYPVDVAPTAEMIQPVLDWMAEKDYLTQPLTYVEETCGFATQG